MGCLKSLRKVSPRIVSVSQLAASRSDGNGNSNSGSGSVLPLSCRCRNATPGRRHSDTIAMERAVAQDSAAEACNAMWCDVIRACCEGVYVRTTGAQLQSNFPKWYVLQGSAEQWQRSPLQGPV